MGHDRKEACVPRPRHFKSRSNDLYRNPDGGYQLLVLYYSHTKMISYSRVSLLWLPNSAVSEAAEGGLDRSAVVHLTPSFPARPSNADALASTHPLTPLEPQCRWYG